MIKFDEMNNGIGFANIFKHFPDHFSLENQQKMNLALVKMNTALRKYHSVEEAFCNEFFTDDEIEGYALWRASVHLNNNPPLTAHLKRKIFEAVLIRFTKYYRTLAGRND